MLSIRLNLTPSSLLGNAVVFLLMPGWQWSRKRVTRREFGTRCHNSGDQQITQGETWILSDGDMFSMHHADKGKSGSGGSESSSAPELSFDYEYSHRGEHDSRESGFVAEDTHRLQ